MILFASTALAGGGGTDISPMCRTGVPCAGVEVLDPRLVARANNPCQDAQEVLQQLMLVDGWRRVATPQVEKRVGVVHQLNSGYFWYHHTAADTMDKLDETQLRRTAASMAIWAYGVASLPTLLPRGGPSPEPDAFPEIPSASYSCRVTEVNRAYLPS